MNSDTSDNSQNIRYGGFWRRALAFLIDFIIIKILNLILIGIGIVASWKALNDLNLSSPSEDLVFLLIGIFMLTEIVFLFIYFFYFNFKGQSPGKKLLGLKIISQSGEPIRPLQALIRSFGALISFLFFFIGFLFILFNKKKLALHDILAGTYVIRT